MITLANRIMITPIECRRNAAGCRQAAKAANTSDNLRRMFLALAQGWIDAALHLEQDIGLKSTEYRNLETQPVTREASPLNAFNQIPVGEMLWSTSRFR